MFYTYFINNNIVFEDEHMANWYGRLAGNVVKRGLSIAINGVTSLGKKES